MELRRLWLLIWHKKILVVLCVAVALAAGYEVNPHTSDYRAVAVMFLNIPPTSQYYSINEFASGQQQGEELLAYTLAQIVPTISVAEGAVSPQIPRSAGQMANETRAAAITSTSLIALTATDPNPIVAQQVANAMSQSFVNYMAKVIPVPSATGALKSPVTITQPASIPGAPLSTGLKRTLILSGVFGFVVSIGMILLLDYVDLSVRNPEELERRLGLSVVGIVPFFPDITKRNWVPPKVRSLRSRGLVGELDG